MRVVLTPECEADIAGTRDWYEDQSPGLGLRFMEAYLVVVRRLADNPRLYQVVRQDIRRAAFPRFPYSLFFRIRGDVVEVFACLHAKQNPLSWQQRTR